MSASIGQLNSLPQTARIWVYAAQRPLTLEEHEYISARLDLFVDEWNAHGKKLQTGFAILHKRFIVLAVDENAQSATGCSIDSSVHEIDNIGQKLGINFFNRLQVVYRDSDNNMVVSTSIADLKQMVVEGDFTPDTCVFDNTITTLHALMNDWEVPASKTYLRKYFAIAE